MAAENPTGEKWEQQGCGRMLERSRRAGATDTKETIVTDPAEPPRQEGRYEPGCHADLASFGSEAEWKIVNTGSLAR